MAVVCKNRSQFLIGCGVGALAVSLVLAPERASAQAFQATPQIVQGNANIDRGIPGFDSIEVTTQTVVIDWIPDEDLAGNALDFLPTGNSATFFDAPGQGGFAALNRILPSTNGNVVVMNGSVVTRLQDGLGNLTPGGVVAFYSPTGFLIGSSAVFDIGGLMFTTLDPDLASFDNFAAGAGALNLIGQTGTTAAITINPGATIVGAPENSFFIAAGAQVNVFGDVGINGSHAYVAAEQVNLTYSNGLFDIIIPVGTSVGNAMALNGNIGGPSSNGAGDNHLVYAVAKAQANPISMFFSGNLGFAPAVSAGIVNGEIILSAGSDVTGNVIGLDNGVDASIFIDSAAISSSVTASASREFFALANTGPLTIDGDLTVDARNLVRLHAINGSTLAISGSTLATSGGLDLGPNRTAGTIELLALAGSTLSIGGDLAAIASAFEGTGTRTGGTAILNTDGGLIQVGGSADLQAVAFGGPGGDATGGTATIFAQNNGSVIIGNDALLNGSANTDLFSSSNTFGGVANISATSSSTISIGGLTSVIADGNGGDSQSIGNGGGGTGGSAFIDADGNGQIDVGLEAFISASGFGGDGDTGGVGTGGTATASARNGGGLDFGQFLSITADGESGDSLLGNGSIGTGGTAGLNTNNGTIAVAGYVSMFAEGEGGNSNSATGGAGIGGRARMSAFGGSISVGDFFETDATGTGGDGVSGGSGTGGIAGAFVGSGAITVGTTATSITLGLGGNAVFGHGGSGGEGIGGNAFIQAEGTLVVDASIDIGGGAGVIVEGIGGSGGSASLAIGVGAGRGGDGRGGLLTTQNAADPAFSNGAFVLAFGDRGALSFGGDLFVSSSGTGGQGGNGDGTLAGGDGGTGFGGTAQAGLFVGGGDGSVSAGTVQFTNVVAEATGIGGAGGSDPTLDTFTGNGGDAIGGNAFLTSRLGVVSANVVTLRGSANGGVGATGGNATAGQAGFLTTNNGTANVAQLIADSSGTGGTGLDGAGGAGTGGDAFIGFQGGTTNIAGGALISANGTGGASTNANGGEGTGGIADIANFTAIQGNATIGGLAQLQANGVGGNANSADFTGGIGRGGEAFLLAQTGSALQINTGQVIASGQGGTGPQAKGGDGFGGDAYIRARDSGSSIVINQGPNGPFNALTQGALLAAIGIGGQSNGGDGIGGTGTGSNIDVTASNGGAITLPASAGAVGSLRLYARGFGGNSTVEGGAGGSGLGGTGTLAADGGTITGGPLHLSTFAQGGNSGLSTANISGGDGQGGQRFISVTNGGTLTAGVPAGVAGGAGGIGSGTGNGGNGFGGIANLEVIGGTANLVGNTIIVAQTSGGVAEGGNGGSATGGLASLIVDDGGVINILPDAGGVARLLIGASAFAGSSTTGNGGNALPQQAIATISGGNVSGGDLEVVSLAGGGSTVSGTGGNAGAGIATLLMTGGGLNLANVQVRSDGGGGVSETGNHGAASGGTSSIQLANATFQTSGDTVVSSTGNTGLDPLQGASTAAGAGADGGAAFVDVFNNATFTAGKLDINSNAKAFQAGSASAGSSILRLVNGDATTTELVLSAVADSAGGSVANGGAVALVLEDTGGGSSLDATLATLENGASGAIGASGASGNTAGEVTIQSTNSLASFGTLNVASTATGGGQVMQWSVNGGSMPISTQANVNVTGGITISATNGAVIGGPTLAAPTASITLETPGVITFTGNDDNAISFGGASLSLNSGELNIEFGARIGANNVFLVSLDTNHTAILGGTTEEVGYTLTAAEVERIEAGTAAFSAPIIAGLSANQPDLLIRDVTLAGSLDDGPSSVSVGTPGIIRVEGVLAYLDAASTDSLDIIGGERIEIVTPGGVAVLDSDGNPSGELFLGSEGSIWAADADLIAQLQADVNFAGRNDLLQTPATGSDDPLGYIRGGSVSIGIDGSLLVRNTGTEAEPGGILAGQGGLSISSFEASSLLDVFAYGRQRNTDGTFVLGEDFYRLVNFERASPGSFLYTEGSSFNDCLINADECQGTGGGMEEVIESAPPVNNPAVVEAPSAAAEPPPPAEEETSAEFGVDFPGLVETVAIAEEATFDDGVMSGGDSSLYSAAEEDEEDDEDEENEGAE